MCPTFLWKSWSTYLARWLYLEVLTLKGILGCEKVWMQIVPFIGMNLGNCRGGVVVWHFFFFVLQSSLPVFLSGKSYWEGFQINSFINHICHINAVVYFYNRWSFKHLIVRESSGSILYHTACQKLPVSVGHHLPGSYLVGYLPITL